MSTTRLRLALTPGDENGVGPELLAQAIYSYKSAKNLDFIWCGDFSSLDLACRRADIPLEAVDDNMAILGRSIKLSHLDKVSEGCPLKRQAQFLQSSVALATDEAKDIINAVVTGPIDKACMKYVDDGRYVGQTDFYAKHLAPDPEKVFMSFMGAPFILTLLSAHMPLNRVAKSISEDLVVTHLTSMAQHAAMILGKEPTAIDISLLSLNPHAGESGMLGSEEDDVFRPAIRRARQLGLRIEGPLAADGFFAYLHMKERTPDLVVAAYHDQGLIPYKLLAKGEAVNATLGLRIPRTSPAHGTASELAGKNIACPRSTIAAIAIAIDLARSHQADKLFRHWD